MAVNIEDLKSLCDFKDGHYESKKRTRLSRCSC